jgi:L-ascorbate metabolism protein UlaG (beta-lactamase superfamily)
MNLPYTMDVDEAAEAVLAFKPHVVYPYHYRGPDGLSDVARFKQLVNEKNSAIEVVLADWYPKQ